MRFTKPLDDCRLYTFIDTAYLRGRDPAELARQLCDGGADLIQIRAKGESLQTLRRITDAVLPVANAAGVRTVVNDEPGLARQVGAPLCHLGQEDFFDAGHRHISDLFPGELTLDVGLSSHRPEQAERAVAAGAAYVAVGPVFSTPTKPGRMPVGLEYVRWAAAELTCPWFAIGGVGLDNLDAIRAAGANRVCVVSAILNRENVAKACSEFATRLQT